MNRPMLDDGGDEGFEVEDDFAAEHAPAAGASIADPFDHFDATDDEAVGEPQSSPSSSAEPRPTAAAWGAASASASAGNPVGALIATTESAWNEAITGGEPLAPRIAIHVFCQSPATAAIAQAAAADRRLSRTTTVVRPGGLTEALALYRETPTPALVVVENMGGADALLQGLDRLAEVCDPGTKVVVIGQANDIGLYRELMRRGVSEYLVPPLQPLQLIRTVTGLYADPSTPFVGRAVAFVGAKGGVGASTLAHNFAFALAEHLDTNTCLVDYDLAFGTAGLDFNQDPIQGLHDALVKPDRLDATLIDRMAARCTDKLSLFAAPANLEDDYDIGADAYEEVSNKIRAAAPFLVLDLPHVWSGWMRKTLMSADDVVVVATPDLASLRNAKMLIDLVSRGRPNDRAPKMILNQVGLPGRPEIPVKEFSKAMGFEPSLVLPFDAKTFGQASNHGQMVLELNAKSKAAEGILQFAQSITRREVSTPKPRSILDRFVKRV